MLLKLPAGFRCLESYLNETAQNSPVFKATKLPAGDANGGFADRADVRPLSVLVALPLLNAGATALNQDDQHKNKKYAGSNPDDCRRVHYDSPFACSDPSGSHGAKCCRLHRIFDE
jgi:hypothetical protein